MKLHIGTVNMYSNNIHIVSEIYVAFRPKKYLPKQRLKLNLSPYIFDDFYNRVQGLIAQKLELNKESGGVQFLDLYFLCILSHRM